MLLHGAVCQSNANGAVQAHAKADGGDATSRHMEQLQDQFLATAAARPDNAIDTLVLMALAYTCWDWGVRESGEAKQRPALRPGAVLRALGQVKRPSKIAMHAHIYSAGNQGHAAHASIPLTFVLRPFAGFCQHGARTQETDAVSDR